MVCLGIQMLSWCNIISHPPPNQKLLPTPLGIHTETVLFSIKKKKKLKQNLQILEKKLSNLEELIKILP